MNEKRIQLLEQAIKTSLELIRLTEEQVRLTKRHHLGLQQLLEKERAKQYGQKTS